MTLAETDLSEYTFPPKCGSCGRAPTVFAKGCMDREPVLMCDDCLKRGLDLVTKLVRMYQRYNKKVMICGDCYRPILTLETHLEIKRI
jgi:hypothetical protein